MTTKNAKTEKFGWNEENAAVAITMYQNLLAEKGVEYANSDGLKEIQQEVGAESMVKVRSKLVSSKVYQKADTPRKVGGASSLRKAHYVRVFAKHAIEAGLIESADDLASMEQMKLEQLETLAQMFNVSEEVKASV